MQRQNQAVRRATTLFEIAIALAILAVAVVGVALAFPAGIKAQRLARFRIYAGSKVLEMMDHFVQHEHVYLDRQVEAERLGQAQFAHQVPVDLDRLMMVSAVCGLLPLPDALARRIDSDGDELAHLLDRGGRVFYPTPRAYEGGAEMLGQQGTGSELPTDAQTLLFGVVGDPQQDALPNHPCLAWPYQEFLPSPPQPWERRLWELHQADPGWIDGWTAFDALYAAVNADTFAAATPAQLDDWLLKAQALVAAVGVPVTSTAGGPVPVPPVALTMLTAPWSPTLDPWAATAPEDAFPRPWKVLAMRCLASAALARTGSRFAAVSADQRDYAVAVEASATAWAMRYATANPYDWGAARPLNRQLAWDAPLLEYDLFPSAAFPRYDVGDGTGDRSWLIVAPRQPRAYGEARSEYGWVGPVPPNHGFIDASWGDPAHQNLTARFAAAERDREIVCWAVDWRAWQDFESAVSGPFDANSSCMDSRGNQVTSERAINPPDLHLYWADATRTATVAIWMAKGAPRAEEQTAAYKAAHLGLFGADRDGNQRFDVGPLPPAVRQRAVQIGRWHYYDRRLIGGARN